MLSREGTADVDHRHVTSSCSFNTKQRPMERHEPMLLESSDSASKARHNPLSHLFQISERVGSFALVLRAAAPSKRSSIVLGGAFTNDHQASK